MVIVSCTFDTMGAIMIIIVIEGLSILSKKSYFGAISIFTKLKDSHFAKEFIFLFFFWYIMVYISLYVMIYRYNI